MWMVIRGHSDLALTPTSETAGRAAALLLSLWPSSRYDFYSPGAHFHVSFKQTSQGDWQHNCGMAAETFPPQVLAHSLRGVGLGADPKGPHGALR